MQGFIKGCWRDHSGRSLMAKVSFSCSLHYTLIERHQHQCPQARAGHQPLDWLSSGAGHLDPLLAAVLWVPGRVPLHHCLGLSRTPAGCAAEGWYPAHYCTDKLWGNIAIKSAEVRQRGETMIVVPCWWDGKTDRYYNPEYNPSLLLLLQLSSYHQVPATWVNC